MRRLLAVLRDTEPEGLATDDHAPQPSLAHLERLSTHVRDSGVPVEVDVVGTPQDLPPGVDLSAYRIVQEALTNVLKHAADARARVRPGVRRRRARRHRHRRRHPRPGQRHRRRRRPRTDRHPRARRRRRRRGGGRSASRGRLRGPGTAPLRAGGSVSIRVVIADDQPLVRTGLRMILSAEPDIEVVGEATDGRLGDRRVPRPHARRGPHGRADARGRRDRGHPRGHRGRRPAAGAGAHHIRPRRGGLRRPARRGERVPAQGRTRGAADHRDQGGRRGRFALRAVGDPAADRGVRPAGAAPHTRPHRADRARARGTAPGRPRAAPTPRSRPSCSSRRTP